MQSRLSWDCLIGLDSWEDPLNEVYRYQLELHLAPICAKLQTKEESAGVVGAKNGPDGDTARHTHRLPAILHSFQIDRTVGSLKKRVPPSEGRPPVFLLPTQAESGPRTYRLNRYTLGEFSM